MDLRQLRYFVAVAELNSFTKAAERCLVSQPSLSQQIMKLESYLGVELLDRSGRGAQLTDAGQLLYARAVEIIAAAEDAERRVRGMSDGPAHLSIGLIPTIAPFVLPRLLGAVAGRADVRVTIHEDVTDRLIDGVTAGGIDLAVMALPWRNAGRLHTTPLWREQLLLMLPAGHALAAVEVVDDQAIRNLSYVALTDVHCLSEHVAVYCEQHRFEPDVVSRASTLQTLRHLVAAGHGVAMIPEMAAEAVGAAGVGGPVVLRPIGDDPPYREIALAWRPNRRFMPRLDRLVNLLREKLPPRPS